MARPFSDARNTLAAPAPAAVPIPAAHSFPLPLSEFEDYMLCDDSPSHPMLIVMLADVTGTLLEPQFRESVAAMLLQQPLLRSRIISLNGANAWQTLSQLPDPVAWFNTDTNPDLCFPDVQPLDVRSGQCIRIRVWFAPTHSRIALELHHSCADGIAAVQLLGQLFTEYAARTGGAAISEPNDALSVERSLPQRSPLNSNGQSEKSRSTPLHLLPGKLARLILRRPAQIADSARRHGPNSKPTQDTPQQAIRVQSLPTQTLANLRSFAAKHNVALNDVLLLEILLHLAHWNSTAGTGNPADWLRIAVPISLRNPRSLPLPACNLVSYALVTHRIRECSNPDQLLQTIHQKTLTMRSGKDGIIALRIFRLLKHIPGGVRAFLALWPCAGTLVLANVGNVTRRCQLNLPLQDNRWIAGNVLVNRICGTPPVRPNTLAALGITEYASQLHISLRTDGTRLNAADSQTFLAQFTARLESLAQAQ